MKNIFIKIFLTLTFTLCFASMAFAQIQLDEKYRPTYLPTVKLTGNAATQPAYFGAYVLQMMAGSLLYFAGPLAVLIISIAGLIATTSAGKDETVAKAKKTITWAVIGLAVIMLSYTIVSAVIQNLDKVSNGQITENSTTPVAPVAPAPPPPGSGSTQPAAAPPA